MVRLRSGLLAVCIAMLSCVSVVGATAANADTTDPASFVWAPGSQAITWGEVDDHGWNYWRQVIFGKDAEINQSLTATAKSPLTSLTGVEVKAGGPNAPAVGNLCKSGYGCTLAGLAGAALAAYGLFGPDGGNVQTERAPINEANFRDKTLHPVQKYPSARTTQCAELVETSLDPANWGANNPTGKGGFWIETKVLSRPNGIWGCGQANMPVGIDCHRNGVWVHVNAQIGGTSGAIGSVSKYAVTAPCGASNTSADWEIRKVHFDQTAPGDSGQNAGVTQGFYWGVADALTDGSMRATTRCQRPDTTQYSVVGAALPVASGVVDVRPCEAGDKPLWVQTDHIGVDGTTVTPQGVQNLSEAAPPDWAPDCKVAGSGCRWVVKVNGQPCTVGQSGCTDWTEHKEDAECFFGPYSMPLESCNLLERAYESQPAGTTMPATRPNWDGDPNTSTGPARQTQPLPSASPSPTSSTGTSVDTDPTTRPSPSPSGSASPVPEAPPGSSGAPNPADTQAVACWPSGWAAANPVQWVLMPIKCAFIPSPSKVASVRTAIGTDVAQSGAAELVTAISAPVDAMSSSSGCEGIVFDLPINGQTFHGSILNACSGPMATAAHFSTVLIGLGVVVSGGLALLRMAGAGFGYNVKVGDGE